jgi:ABC-type phosphate/phosphonate transport system permease subunit
MGEKNILLFLVFLVFFGESTNFHMEKPQLQKTDSLKTDSVFIKKFNSEFFKKDTANFTIKEKKSSMMKVF